MARCRLPVGLATGLLVAVLAGCGGPHPCGDGRTCIPEAGVSLALAADWRTMSPKDGDNLLVAALDASEAGPGVMLKDGRELLGWLPTGLDELETAALQLNHNNLFVTGDAEADRLELPIGSAVRVRYVRQFAWMGPFASIDYWFFAGGRLLVLTYMELSAGGTPTDSPPALDAMVQSISLIE
jgi:hypothetical protein